MSRSLLKKFLKANLLLIDPSKSELLSNLTLVGEREGDKTTHEEQLIDSAPSRTMLELSAATASSHDVIRGFLEDSVHYYKTHGMPSMSTRLMERKVPETKLLSGGSPDPIELSQFVKNAISFVNQPAQKSVTVVFSSEAPDLSQTSEHQQLTDEITGVVSLLHAFFLMFDSLQSVQFTCALWYYLVIALALFP